MANGSKELPFAFFLAVFVLVMLTPAWAKTTVSIGTDPTKKVIKGKIVTPNELIEGKLVIEGDTIKCVGVTCDEPADATFFIVTDAYVFPGFIDAHNHVAYNVLPKWNPPKTYKNRGQWQGDKSYKAFKKPYDDLKRQKLSCEMIKYGELKSLLSGVTTIQGTSPSQNCFKVLIRNAENQNNLGTPTGYIRTYILDIKGWDETKDKIDFNKTKSFVVHIGEGIDEKSRKEFNTLKQKGLLVKETAIIHGTAFGEKEFTEMAQVGAKLIWSPQSNLALYNKTTDVKLALQKGVSVSLGVDWNPTGSNTMLDELRVAERVNEEEFGGAIPDSAWIKMITVNPAKALALEKHIGALKAGLKADISVLKSKDSNHAKSLLYNQLEDVEMVWVGGNLLYGDETVINKVKKSGCEPLLVHGSKKQICVKDTAKNVVKSGQSLGDIQEVLQGAYSGLAPLVP